jgi:hypothetical protein
MVGKGGGYWVGKGGQLNAVNFLSGLMIPMRLNEA